MKTTIRSLLLLSKVKADCQRYVGGAQGSFLNTSLTNSNGEEETLTLYKTGDFAKIVDGRLYYEGRLDAQVSREHPSFVFLLDILTAKGESARTPCGSF